MAKDKLETASDSAFHGVQLVGNGASSTVKVNNGSVTTVAASPGNQTFATVTVAGGANVWHALFEEAGVWCSGISSANQGTLYSNESTRYGSIF